MKLTSESFPYKHIANVNENTPLLTSMIRTYVLLTGNTRRERNLRLTDNYQRRGSLPRLPSSIESGALVISQGSFRTVLGT